MDLFAPVVDHGEGEMSAFLNIEFRDPDVKAGNDPGVGGAAGDDVERGALLHHHQVVHVLGKPVGAQVEARLHRLGDFSPLGRPDEITVVQLQLGGGGVFVGVHRHQAPEEVFDPVVAAHRFGDGQNFHPRLPGLAVDDGLVGLEEGAGMVFVGELDAGGEEAAALLRGKLPVVRVILPGAALAGKLLQVEITAQRPPFSADSVRPAVLSPTFGTFLVTEVLDVLKQIPGVALTAEAAVAQDVGPVGVDVIHDEAGVGDDQAGFFPGLGAALLLEQVGDDLPTTWRFSRSTPDSGSSRSTILGSWASSCRSSERLSSPPEKP